MSGRIVAAARGWIGTPYLHQASCKGAGTDCLGLVRGVWREVIGPEPEKPPPYSADWGDTSGEEQIMQAALRHLRPVVTEPLPGDVLVFRMRSGGVAKHLGLLSATGCEARFIHAYSGHAVLESPLSLPWARRIVARFRFPLEE